MTNNLSFIYECCGMPVSQGHSTGCDNKYNVTFPPETMTSGTSEVIRKKSKLITFDRFTWHLKVSIARVD